MHYIQPYNRNQTLFFSSLDDFVSSEHPVRILDAIISKIVKNNPEKFKHKGQQDIGRRAYSPETMLKLFIYGYLNGISSSRKLEVETYRNIEVKWLLGDLQPDHKTISNYRKDNEAQIRSLTIEFRRFLKEQGYIKGKTVAVDGTKVKANTNRDMLTMDKIEQRLSNLEKQLQKYFALLARNDTEEDILDETDSLELDSVNKHLVDKIVLLQAKIGELEKAKAILEESGKKHLSPTDPDASLMKSREGKIPAYNVQTVVDSENKMIADAVVSTNSNDLNELSPVMYSLNANLSVEPEEVLADKGYYNPEEIKELEEGSTTTYYIPRPASSRDKEEVEFTYDSDKDEYRCSEGKRLVLKQKDKLKKGRLTNVYQGIECKGCPLRSRCTKSKYGRIYHRYHDQDWRDDYKERVRSQLGIYYIKKRKEIIEHVFGTMKYWMGKIPLLLRGKDKVQTEINIYTTAYNLKRLINIESFDRLMAMINEYSGKITEEISSFYNLFLSLFKKCEIIFSRYRSSINNLWFVIFTQPIKLWVQG